MEPSTPPQRTMPSAEMINFSEYLSKSKRVVMQEFSRELLVKLHENGFKLEDFLNALADNYKLWDTRNGRATAMVSAAAEILEFGEEIFPVRPKEDKDK